MAIAPVKRPSSNCRSVASPGTTVTFVPTSRAASAAVELGVELHSSYLVCPVAQQVRGHAGPGADLEHVITEARTRRCVRKDLVAQEVPPLDARTQFDVFSVHRSTVRPPGESAKPVA
jgi:hypothetical protein